MKTLIASFLLLLVAAPGRAAGEYESPLEAKVTLKMKRASLRDFLTEVARQSKVRFYYDPGLERCQVTAFLKNRTAKEVIQIALEVRGVSLQRMGMDGIFTISPRKDAPVCPAPPRPAKPKGRCRSAEEDPITLKCSSAPLEGYAEKLHDAAGLSFFFPNAGENESISADLHGATDVQALAALSKVRSISDQNFSGIHLLRKSDKRR